MGSKLPQKRLQLIIGLQKRVLYFSRMAGTERMIWAKTRTFSMNINYTFSLQASSGVHFLVWKWSSTTLFWLFFQRSSCSINRGGHWRLRARVSNTKHLSLKAKQSLSQSSSSTKQWNSIISHYIFRIVIFWVCFVKSQTCVE